MRLVISTAPVDAAPGLAVRLVEQRLAACVNIVPKVRSIYRWQGKTEDDEEAMLFIKTTAAEVDRLTERLRELHPYDVPEIIALSIEAGEGNPDYLDWVRRNAGSE